MEHNENFHILSVEDESAAMGVPVLWLIDRDGSLPPWGAVQIFNNR